MKIVCFGSLNIDHVYKVENFVSAGETISSVEYNAYPGGKGLNQSVAIAKADAEIYHAGSIGPDGNLLIKTLVDAGVSKKFIKNSKLSTGQAVIQVNKNGQNCIIITPGANQDITNEDVDIVLSNFGTDDILLLQNEIANIGYIMERAHAAGLKIVFNPSPITKDLLSYPLEYVDLFILNEIESMHISKENNNSEILRTLKKQYPNASILLTLGSDGCMYKDHDIELTVTALKVDAIDTTGAGDTFCGYFLAGIAQGFSVEEALKQATAAASIAVTRVGAAIAVPTKEEVYKVLHENNM